MKRTQIKKTGLEVTSLCFGTSGLGDMPDTYGYAVSEERARETLDAIFEGPVNFLDTSNNYGFGRSEPASAMQSAPVEVCQRAS